MKQQGYKWHEKDGLTLDGNQVLQLVGGTKKFRRQCGQILADGLNYNAIYFSKKDDDTMVGTGAGRFADKGDLVERVFTDEK